ncbi:MAG: hypothetical protein J7M25_16720 [Deltaproteobacteria bacterium]|nr:hypothetical protein [Deltaproteobacteria bacterium]
MKQIPTPRLTDKTRAWLLPTLAIVLAGCVAGPIDHADTTMRAGVQSDLPITKVVLYQSGVGYFERAGRIKGNLLRLRIRPDQVMDVLKSLTVVDLRGGHAVTVALPAERSKLMETSQLPPQVRQSGGLLAIATAFRGATAVVSTPKGRFRGRLVGVENIGTSKDPDWRLTLMRRSGTLTSHKIRSISSIRVLERSLTVGLEKSLDLALNKGKWKPVTLTVRLSGGSRHDLVVSYVVPMPTWKPAYRLVMDSKNPNGSKVLLQGWSVVDNLSGENWVKAHLSLTAGTPLSFRYDLYTPRDVRRPDLTPSARSYAEAPPAPVDATEGSGAVAAPPASKAMTTGSTRAGAGMGGRGRGRFSRRANRYRRSHRVHYKPKMLRKAAESAMAEDARRRPMGSTTRAVSMNMMRRSYQALVSGKSVGSLFRYDIAQPVTVPDRSSALVSIVNKMVPGSDVLYYIVNSARPNPYRAVRFKNDTGYVLERGPVAIYRQGAFVGEALGGRIERGASAFVPYALEGRVIVQLSSRNDDEGIKLARINRGYITIESQNVAKFTYRVVNRTGKAITLYVARRRRPGWTLVQPPKAVMERSLYYAPIPLAATGTTTFTVKEQTPVRRVLTVFDPRARTAIALMVKGGHLPSSLASQLNKVLTIWEELGRIQSKMSTLASSMSAYRTRLQDIRRNMKVLGTKGNRDLRRKLARTMTNVETRLNGLNRKWVELNMRRGALRQRLSVQIKLIKWHK